MKVMLMLNIYFACGSIQAGLFLWQLYRFHAIAEANIVFVMITVAWLPLLTYKPFHSPQ